MKGPIPDLSKPSPFRVLLRERREKSIAAGNKLLSACSFCYGRGEIVNQWGKTPCVHCRASESAEYLPNSLQGARDYLPESKPVEIEPEYAEITRQMG